MKILIAKGNHMVKFRWLFGKRFPIIAQKILLNRSDQEARTPFYSSYDAEDPNLIGTPVAQQTKIIRKAPLPHCDE